MKMTILDGKKVSENIKARLKKEISTFSIKPTLAIIQIGDKKESTKYIERKIAFGKEIGAGVNHIKFGEDVSDEKIISEISRLNSRKDINGIIVQIPIPKKLDRFKIIESIDPKKDVDGLTLKNAGLLYESAFGGNDPKNIPEGLTPATAKGVMTLISKYKINLSGKKVLVIGRSLLVGKPLALLALKQNATVTIAHSKTKNLSEEIKKADIVFVGVGKIGLITKKDVKVGQVIVDIGTNAVLGPKILEEVSKIKLVGDVDFKGVSQKVSFLSPVPGGVGPMTVASLFENLVQAYKGQVG